MAACCDRPESDADRRQNHNIWQAVIRHEIKACVVDWSTQEDVKIPYPGASINEEMFPDTQIVAELTIEKQSGRKTRVIIPT